MGIIPEAVCVEAPEGQPMIHRRHTRQVSADQRGNPRKEAKDHGGPPSSPWTRIAKRELGGCFPEPLHDEWDVSGKT